MSNVPHISSPPTLAEVSATTLWWKEEQNRVCERPKHRRSMLGITRSEMDAILSGKSRVNLEWRISIALIVTLLVGGTAAGIRISHQLNTVASQTVELVKDTKKIGSDVTSMKVRVAKNEEEILRLRKLLDK